MKPIIYHGHGADSLTRSAPAGFHKPTLQKTIDELHDGIQYMLGNPGFCQLAGCRREEHEKVCAECGEEFSGVAVQKYCDQCTPVVRRRQDDAASRRWRLRHPERVAEATRRRDERRRERKRHG